jgi:membrane fusion protein (multidrug efflux system)
VVGEWHLSDWIVERGLGAGETVVVEGIQRLQQGMTVRPVPWVPTPAGGAARAPAAAASR